MTPQEKEQLNNIEKKLDDFLYFYNKESYENRLEIKRTLVLKDVENKTEFDNFAGLKLGHSTSKIGLYGVDPVIRANAILAPIIAGSTYNQSQMQSVVDSVNQIRVAIKNFGIIA